MTAPNTARVWCSCVIINYLTGEPRSKDACDGIVEDAARGNAEIWVSALALAEVAHLGASDPSDAEAIISAFFSEAYVKVIQLDRQVALVARQLIRAAHQQGLSIRGADAVHVASAIHHKVPVFESTDRPLLRNLGRLDYPGLGTLVAREPAYEGPATFPGMRGP